MSIFRRGCFAPPRPLRPGAPAPTTAVDGDVFLSPYTPHTHTHGDPHTHGRPAPTVCFRRLVTPLCYRVRRRLIAAANFSARRNSPSPGAAAPPPRQLPLGTRATVTARPWPAGARLATAVHGSTPPVSEIRSTGRLRASAKFRF